MSEAAIPLERLPDALPPVADASGVEQTNQGVPARWIRARRRTLTRIPVDRPRRPWRCRRNRSPKTAERRRATPSLRAEPTLLGRPRPTRGRAGLRWWPAAATASPPSAARRARHRQRRQVPLLLPDCQMAVDRVVRIVQRLRAQRRGQAEDQRQAGGCDHYRPPFDPPPTEPATSGSQRHSPAPVHWGLPYTVTTSEYVSPRRRLHRTRARSTASCPARRRSGNVRHIPMPDAPFIHVRA